MSVLKNGQSEQKEAQPDWGVIESSPDTKAVLMATIAARASEEEARKLLEERGHVVRPQALVRHIQKMGGNERYIRSLRGNNNENDPPSEVVERQRRAVRDRLLSAERFRFGVITAFPDTRALYWGLIGHNATIETIAKVFNLYLREPKGMVPGN